MKNKNAKSVEGLFGSVRFKRPVQDIMRDVKESDKDAIVQRHSQYRSQMKIFKLVVYVPVESERQVRLALGNAGAGKIGAYDYCAFVSKGAGHYRPLKGTTPYKGEIGRVANVDECRIETVCLEKDLPRILAAMREAHPYEEVAYDIIPLLNDKYAKYVPRKRHP